MNISFIKINKNFKTELNFKSAKLVNLNYSRDLLHDLLCYQIKSKEKYCFYGDINNSSRIIRFLTSKIYSQIDKINFKDSEHELVRQNKLLNDIFIFKNDEDELLNFHHSKKSYCIVSPGANSKQRYLKKNQLNEILKYLDKSYYGDVYVTGTEDEGCFYRDINKFNHKNLFGTQSIKELSELIKHADFIIATDSGTAHIARLFKKKLFVILGGGHFKRFFPYPNEEHTFCIYSKMNCFNCNWYCKYTTYDNIPPCVEKIPIHKIIENIKAHGI
jgi:ADP-heptose:LPS heptosyltransferase